MASSPDILKNRTISINSLAYIRLQATFLPSKSMATAVSNLRGTSQMFPTGLLKYWKANHRSSRLMVFASKSMDAFQEPQLQFHNGSGGISLQVSRRASVVGLAAVTFLHLIDTGISYAEEENNGLWLTGPIPSPTVTSGMFLHPLHHLNLVSSFISQAFRIPESLEYSIFATEKSGDKR